MGRRRKDSLTMVVENIAERACVKAISYTQAGRPGRAEYELVRAGIRIADQVGDHASAAVLGELRLFEPFRDLRVGDLGGVA